MIYSHSYIAIPAVSRPALLECMIVLSIVSSLKATDQPNTN